MGSNKSISCFLIDDDADDREIFSIALSEIDQDIELITAKDGRDGLEKLEDESFVPDLIFLDLNMPRFNGRQCLGGIKKISRLKTVPVIIYSTSAQQRDKDETLEMGASSFITKPSNIKILIDTLNEILSNHGFGNILNVTNQQSKNE